MSRITYLTGLMLVLIFLTSCTQPAEEQQQATETTKGKLFIIGGGKRPPEMIDRLIAEAKMGENEYAVILPMASSEPDTSAWYATKQFTDKGVKHVVTFNFDSVPNAAWTDSLRAARLIYITGGDQSRFMDVVLDTPVHDAIRHAYKNGATIAGTSAGAAVMSEKMITGNEFKHPEYTGDFKTIEAENMELKRGLGLLENAIVDQHFIWRMRMNRLITVAIENPEEMCIGIDESTAILVKGNVAEVVGNYQVVTLQNPDGSKQVENGLLGADGLILGVHLPGDTFIIE